MIRAWDRVYRSWHELDAPRAAIGPILRLELRRTHRTVRLADGEVLVAGDPFGMLHLNNEQVSRLHRAAATPVAVGLQFRRQLLKSLHALAVLARPGAPLAGVEAFAAITILHRGLMRLGFERDRRQLTWPGMTGAYQRALLASLHPWGNRRLLRLAHCHRAPVDHAPAPARPLRRARAHRRLRARARRQPVGIRLLCLLRLPGHC